MFTSFSSYFFFNFFPLSKDRTTKNQQDDHLVSWLWATKTRSARAKVPRQFVTNRGRHKQESLNGCRQRRGERERAAIAIRRQWIWKQATKTWSFPCPYPSICCPFPHPGEEKKGKGGNAKEGEVDVGGGGGGVRWEEEKKKREMTAMGRRHRWMRAAKMLWSERNKWKREMAVTGRRHQWMRASLMLWNREKEEGERERDGDFLNQNKYYDVLHHKKIRPILIKNQAANYMQPNAEVDFQNLLPHVSGPTMIGQTGLNANLSPKSLDYL